MSKMNEMDRIENLMNESVVVVVVYIIFPWEIYEFDDDHDCVWLCVPNNILYKINK